MTRSTRDAQRLLLDADPHPVTPDAHRDPAAQATLRNLLAQRANSPDSIGPRVREPGPDLPAAARLLPEHRSRRRTRGTAEPSPDVVRWVFDEPIPPSGAQAPRVPARGPRRRILSVAAAAVTAGVVMTAVVTTRDDPSPVPPPAATRATTSPTTSPPGLPAGWQRVSSLGVEVDAPAAWPINPSDSCSAPPTTPEVVRAKNGGLLCGGRYELDPENASIAPVRPGLVIRRITVPQPTDPPGTRRTTTVSGSSAVATTHQLPGGFTETVLQVPSRDVEVSVTNQDTAVVDRIIASIRAVGVDSVGCHIQLPATPAWDHRGTGPKVDVGQPRTIGICLYTYDARRGGSVALMASATLTGTAARTAAAALNTARAGAIPDVANACGFAPPPPVLLLLHYADGSTVQARIRAGGCSDRWVATPTGVSQPTVAQLDAIVGPLRATDLALGYHESLPTR